MIYFLLIYVLTGGIVVIIQKRIENITNLEYKIFSILGIIFLPIILAIHYIDCYTISRIQTMYIKLIVNNNELSASEKEEKIKLIMEGQENEK